MNYKTLTIAGIISIIVVGAIVYWVWPSTPTLPGAQTPVGSNLSGYYDTVSPTNPGGTTSGQTAAVDLEAAYAAMFQKLLAHRVVFARVSSGDVYALYENDVAQSREWYPSKTDFSIGVAMEDITDDGVAEALVLDDLPGSCGAAGCPLTIYQKKGAAWESVFASQIQSEVGLANVITNGHLDLFLVQQGYGDSYQTAVRRYVWDGQKYSYKELAAAWDGSTFVVYGQ